jgi:CRP-like cAMP-binding protein
LTGGREKGAPIAELGPGEIVGEVGVRQNQLRTATVTARSRLQLLHVGKTEFDRLTRQIPEFRRRSTRPSRNVVADPADLSELRREFDETLLGGARKYTRVQISERAGISIERAERIWHALGFATVPDDEVAFTDSDIEAAPAARRAGEGRLHRPGDRVVAGA